MPTRQIIRYVSSTLRATLAGTIPAGVTDDADDGGSTSWASSQPSRYGPPELHPRQRQMLRPRQPTVIRTISMVDPLVRSPILSEATQCSQQLMPATRCDVCWTMLNNVVQGHAKVTQTNADPDPFLIQTTRFGLVVEGRFLARQGGETDIRSFEAIANPIHYFVARLSGQRSSAICIVSALRLFKPEALGVCVDISVQIFDENVRKLSFSFTLSARTRFSSSSKLAFTCRRFCWRSS